MMYIIYSISFDHSTLFSELYSIFKTLFDHSTHFSDVYNNFNPVCHNISVGTMQGIS